MKQQILFFLLIATIIFTACKEDPATPIDSSAFVGKWGGQMTYILLNSKLMELDTITLELNPNNSTQLINSKYKINTINTIYTVTDTKNYTKANLVRTEIVNEKVYRLLITTNSKGVLLNPTTIVETGDIAINNFYPVPYTITYTKQ